jgi:hypothetical protein
VSQGQGAGRPEVWTPQKKEEAIVAILARIATSRDSLATICKEEGMPSERLFFKWKREDEKLSQDYAHAKEEQADLIFEEMLDISDDSRNDWVKKQQGEQTIDALNPEAIARSRLRIDTRKWALGKLRPKKYGERLALAGDADSPIHFTLAEKLKEARERAEQVRN